VVFLLAAAMLRIVIFTALAVAHVSGCAVTITAWRHNTTCSGDNEVISFIADGNCNPVQGGGGEYVLAAVNGKVLTATFYESKFCVAEQIAAEASEYVRDNCVHLGGGVFSLASWPDSAQCRVATVFPSTPSSAVFIESQLTGSPSHGMGIDVSDPISSSTFTCMKTQGVDYVVVRAWHSSGTFDSNAPATVAAAHSAGITDVDVYMFPCPTCGNAANQVTTMINDLKSGSVDFSMLWFDIEGPQYWTDQTTNVAFMTELMKTASSLGVSFGIYTSDSQWVPIMGSSTIGSSYQLWYAHYDNEENFNDFSAFGGWTSPSVKQYAGDATLCGSDVDLDWRP